VTIGQLGIEHLSLFGSTAPSTKFLIVLENRRVRSDTGLIARAPAQMQVRAIPVAEIIVSAVR
jgi:hypothetical protein